jgi:glucose-1-phosphate cytidylyltransferase
MLTYGDGVGDIDIAKTIDYHRSHGRLATITSTQPTGRYGALNLTSNNQVSGFQEKPQGDGGWINAGFFVMEPEVFDYIDGDSTILEKEPWENLSIKGELMAYKHVGFWQPMDTLRDKSNLEELWRTGKAPWKVWK